MNKLLSDVSRLRRACPWYQAQTLESMRTYIAEELQEVLGALDAGDSNALKEELGDLLFQIVLYSQLARELGWFTMPEVIESLHHKIIRRNQHVFGDLVLADIEGVNQHWHTVKARERNRDRKETTCEMYDITIEQHEAAINIENYPAVRISLEPPPAYKYESGYTQAAWIWLALNDALEDANITVEDEDIKNIAIKLSREAPCLRKCDSSAEYYLRSVKK